MKYLFQFCILMIFVLMGEVLACLIPFPMAGSIYGLVLLFLALCMGIVKLHWVEGIANWFHSVMGLFFIAPAVAIIDIWADISDIWWILVLLLVVAYLVTMITTGITAETLINKTETNIKKRRPGGRGK